MTCFDSAGVVQDIGENLEMKGKKEIQEWAKTLVEKYKLKVLLPNGGEIINS